MIAPLKVYHQPKQFLSAALAEATTSGSDRRDVLLRGLLTLLLMPFFFHFAFGGRFNAFFWLSGAAGWGAIILLFLGFYLGVLKWADRRGWTVSEDSNWNRTNVFFHSFAVQETYWLFLGFTFFLAIAFNLLDSISGYYGITMAVLFIPALVYNYVVTYLSFSVQIKKGRRLLVFAAYFWATWLSAGAHAYFVDYIYLFI